MAKGTHSESSSGQTASAVQAAMRKRGANTKAKSSGRGDGNAGELKLYTEDAPGLQIGPSTVLLLSLSYIAVVVILHIVGKLKG
eukprot:CAMPEP_0202949528 /NCGR_PEP_ID=MMETSP1395-20130829/16211_1 /ASSEMBLY_ACC=CAM_ASM_000871 /TAXON_ID=5961 /ORGANISM="Blepharisma japonicum, Strain Stock R1072" /LENGTH=83 /DNA_ID=CAMNT_0049652635 /DNA_START=20 /DNA_END=271 /DNA_ORIENTATION=+